MNPQELEDPVSSELARRGRVNTSDLQAEEEEQKGSGMRRKLWAQLGLETTAQF